MVVFFLCFFFLDFFSMEERKRKSDQLFEKETKRIRKQEVKEREGIAEEIRRENKCQSNLEKLEKGEEREIRKEEKGEEEVNPIQNNDQEIEKEEYNFQDIDREEEKAILALGNKNPTIFSNACFSLSVMWQFNLRVHNRAHKKRKAKKVCTEAAQRGHVEAAYFLSHLLYEDSDEASLGLTWIQQAAELGHKEAQFELGISLRQVGYVEPSLTYLVSAALKGQDEAQVIVGILCQEGTCGTDIRGVEKKRSFRAKGDTETEEDDQEPGPWSGLDNKIREEMACEWFFLAAEQGCATAMTQLAWLYRSGQGIEKDEKESIRLFTLASEGGNEDACRSLGCLYLKGEGVPQDSKRAMEYFLDSARIGSKDSQSFLGSQYQFGDNALNIEKDNAKAIYWLTKAAAQGDVDAEYRIGAIYLADQEYEKAFKWIQMAAEKGNSSAMSDLGYMYQNGQAPGGVSIEAIRHGALMFQAAALQGNGCGHFNYAWCLLFGQGVDQDKERAAEYFEKALKAGFEESEGILILFGLKGRKKDYQQAKFFLEQSPVGEAQFLLGYMYEKGLGEGKNLLKAQNYYQKAEAEGFLQAKEALEYLILEQNSL